MSAVRSDGSGVIEAGGGVGTGVVGVARPGVLRAEAAGEAF